jgi:VWFA-related protein
VRTTEFWFALALIVWVAFAGCANTSSTQPAGQSGTSAATPLTGIGIFDSSSAQPIQPAALDSESPYRLTPIAKTPPDKVCKGAIRPPAKIAQTPGYNEFKLRITDPSGELISHLEEADLSVTSGGHLLQIVTYDGSTNEGPVSLAILVDTSGSMTPKLSAVRVTVANLINSLDACDQVALLAFSKRVFLLQQLTTQHELVISRLALLHAYGQTAIYDALDQALKILDGAEYPNRAILLITDGMDNGSESTLDDVLGEERDRHVPIYTIGIGDPDAHAASQSVSIGPFTLPTMDDIERVDAGALEKLAAVGGGRVWIISTVAKDGGKEFTDAVSGVASALGNGYTVGVVMPPDTPAGAIPRFTIKGHPDAIVRVTPDALIRATPITEGLTEPQ